MPLTTSTLNKKYNQNIQQVYKKQPRILRFVVVLMELYYSQRVNPLETL